MMKIYIWIYTKILIPLNETEVNIFKVAIAKIILEDRKKCKIQFYMGIKSSVSPEVKHSYFRKTLM